MRRVHVTMLLFPILAILIAGCGSESSVRSPDPSFRTEEPPSLIGTAGTQEIHFLKGSYRWRNAIADAPTPDTLVQRETVYAVEPHSVLSLQFQGEGPAEIRGGIWKNEGLSPLPIEGDRMTLPSEPGRYVLFVGGNWSDQDYGSYAAAIEVIG